jgi:hypothetical protein
MKLEFSRQIYRKKTQISNFLKIRPAGGELFHADQQTGMTDANSLFSANLPAYLKYFSTNGRGTYMSGMLFRGFIPQVNKYTIYSPTAYKCLERMFPVANINNTNSIFLFHLAIYLSFLFLARPCTHFFWTMHPPNTNQPMKCNSAKTTAYVTQQNATLEDLWRILYHSLT